MKITRFSVYMIISIVLSLFTLAITVSMFGQRPDIGIALAMSSAAVMPPSVAEAFAQVFQPKVQFPRWFQPAPEIGAILVHSQEEEDGLKARDWTPKPLPGSEAPRKPMIATSAELASAAEALQAERELFEQQKAAFMAEVDAKLTQVTRLAGQMTQADTVSRPAAAPAPAPAPGGGADVAALSDASSPPAPVSASKK